MDFPAFLPLPGLPRGTSSPTKYLPYLMSPSLFPSFSSSFSILISPSIKISLTFPLFSHASFQILEDLPPSFSLFLSLCFSLSISHTAPPPISSNFSESQVKSLFLTLSFRPVHYYFFSLNFLNSESTYSLSLSFFFTHFLFLLLFSLTYKKLDS